MASDEEVTEFIAFTLKHPENLPSPSFDSVLSTLKLATGVTSVQHGARLEDPATHLVVVRWSSHDAFAGFSASEAFTPWLADFKALTARAPLFYQSRLQPGAGDTTSALDAPCTEVIVAYGVERPHFSQNLELFSFRMSERGKAGEMEGWHGNAWGQVTTPIVKDDGEGEPKQADTLLVGWDSKEAHENARAGSGGRELRPIFISAPLFLKLVLRLRHEDFC